VCPSGKSAESCGTLVSKRRADIMRLARSRERPALSEPSSLYLGTRRMRNRRKSKRARQDSNLQPLVPKVNTRITVRPCAMSYEQLLCNEN
jgi:hypothetical protein